MHWNAGDEAVIAEQDYGAMLNHFKFIERRFHTVKQVSISTKPVSYTAE